MENSNTTPILGEIILYQPDDFIRLEVMVEDETVWLTQAQMGNFSIKTKELFRSILATYSEMVN